MTAFFHQTSLVAFALIGPGAPRGGRARRGCRSRPSWRELPARAAALTGPGCWLCRPARYSAPRIGLVRRRRLVRSQGLTELRARLVAALPVVLGTAQGLARGLTTGRADGRTRAHAASCTPCDRRAP